jgi:predicted HD superfamily hydrolase involved in NAD metabolism
MNSMYEGISDLVDKLPDGLRRHSDTVKSIAENLANVHNADADLAVMAAKGHDIARLIAPHDLLKHACEYKIPLTDVDRQIPMLLHGPVGAEMLLSQFPTLPDSVYRAIYWHTTFNADLDDIGKIVFLADKLDPQKSTRYPYQRLLQDLSEKNLNRAVKEFLNREIISLVNQSKLVHPRMLEARNMIIIG